MLNKPIIYQKTDFRQTISPDLYSANGIARSEHWNTIAGQLRPWRTLSVSTIRGYGSDSLTAKLNSFAILSNVPYALGENGLTGFPALFKWNQSTFDAWDAFVAFSSGASAGGLVAYKNALYGLWKGSSIFKCTSSGILTEGHAALSYTHFSTPLVHSKDNLLYFFTDNIVTSFDGTTPTTVLTLPTNFQITSACEDGDFIMIIGFDTDGKATGFLWDRDSSLTTLTAKYDLGTDSPRHVSKLGGTTFIVSVRGDVSNSLFTDNSALTIRVRNGDRADIFMEYHMPKIILHQFGLGMYATSHRLYFSAYAKLQGDSVAKHLVFRLDYDGKLSIALNLGINGGLNPVMPAIFRDGDMWWIGGLANGSWNSVDSYTTISSFESNIIRSDDLTKNLDIVGIIVTCEPMPASGQILVQARKNEETAWTTLKTFTTDNSIKLAVSAIEAKNALNGLDRAKHAQIRLESTGGAVITGLQATFNSVADENHG